FLNKPRRVYSRSAESIGVFSGKDAARNDLGMVGSFQWESYREALLFLATASVVVPLFHRLHISPVLGFLLAGACLGPFGLGRLAQKYAFLAPLAITDVDQVARVAEFGLVFLLFMIGL